MEAAGEGAAEDGGEAPPRVESHGSGGGGQRDRELDGGAGMSSYRTKTAISERLVSFGVQMAASKHF
jgi:hypothetical protein